MSPARSLTAGANTPVPTTPLRAVLSWLPTDGLSEIDVSALLLGPGGRVRDDADLVFYNQPRHLSGAVRQDGPAVEVDLPGVEPEIERIVLAASLDAGTFGQVADLVLRLDTAADEAIAEFPITASTETALIGGELYRRGDGWRFRAVGQGYDAGLAALTTDFGVTIDEEPEPASVASARTGAAEDPTVGLPRPAPPRVPDLAEWPDHLAPLPFAPQLAPVDPQLEARKQRIADTLARNGAPGARARVVLVLDASGSMSLAYVDGVVGRIVERVAPIAAVLDIGVVRAWKFADTAQQLPDLHVDRVGDWIAGLDYHGVGLRNNEPAAIRAVLDHAATHGDPTLVLFFADGDVRRNLETSVLLRAASAKPVFWQFVGRGPADFTRYAKLDTMKIRLVDNCGFARLSNPDHISDGRFYDLLLAEFPRWLAAARAKGIVTG